MPQHDAAVPSPTVIVEFLRQAISRGISPEQLHALGDILSLWQDASGVAAIGKLGECWFVLFSAMLRAGMAQDAVDLRRRYSKKPLLSLEQESAIAKDLSGQAAAAFALASPYQQVSGLAADLLQTQPTGATAPSTFSAIRPLCPHKVRASGGGESSSSSTDAELYRVAVASGQAAGIADFDPALMATTIRDRGGSGTADAVSQVVQAAQARGQHARAAALATSFHSSSNLLRTTSAIASVLARFKHQPI
jgi:hypothetical protein